MQTILRKYATSATCLFDLFDPTGSNILTSAAIPTSAVFISIDEGSQILPTNSIVVGSNGFSINFTSLELTAKRLKIKIIDPSPTKTWLDTSILIETYGTSGSMHGDLASGLLDNLVDTVPLRDLIIEMVSQLTGDIIRSGDAFEYFKRDGSTQSHTLSAAYGARVRV